METRPLRVPMPPLTHYVGPIKRYAILVVYCFYALATGAIMFLANLGLYITENLLEFGWTLHNIPAMVDQIIDNGNARIMEGKAPVEPPDPAQEGAESTSDTTRGS